MASSTVPRGLHVLAVQAIYDLQSAEFLCFIIRNRRFALVVYSGFTSGEYHVIRVDFIVALRRTKGRGRRTLRSPPSPSSGLHLIHPGNPLRRGILAAAVDRDIVSLFPVQVACPHFDISFGCFVFGLVSLAFQSGCWAMVVRFSLLGGWTVRS